LGMSEDYDRAFLPVIEAFEKRCKEAKG
jgi:hypothetical protein